MRKEKSRDAARSRRGKENYEFYELAKLLPLPAAITSQLDKASIIRLSISYLKLRDFSGRGDPPWSREGPVKSPKGGHVRSRSVGVTVGMELFEQHQGTHILQSLDGFAFVLAADGRFLYVSETVSIYLGLSQVEMTGSNVFDYVHHQDHAEMAEQMGINLSPASGSPASDDGSSTTGGPSTPTPDRPAPVMTLNSNNMYKGLERVFCIRMKSTLTKRGCHFKSSGYRVVLLLTHLRPQYSFSHSRKNPPVIIGMVALAIALPPPSMNEVRLESDMFVTRLTFDFRIAHCEPRVSELLDYTAEEMTGKNMYLLCHGQDVQKLRQCHIDLIHKGQVMSEYYRVMNKTGGYIWIQTCATIICNNKSSEEQSIICVNYVLSGTEYQNYVMDCSQMRHINNLKLDDPSTSEKDNSLDKEGRDKSIPDNSESVTSSPKITQEENSAENENINGDHLSQLRSNNNCQQHLLGTIAKIPIPENSALSFLENKQIHITNETSYEEEKLNNEEISSESSYPKEQRRKRKLQNLSTSTDTDNKSPKRKESSLETVSVDNGIFIVDGSSNLSDNSERLGMSSKEESCSPISLSGNQTNENNKEVTRPWRRSPNHIYPEISNNLVAPMKDLEETLGRHLPNSSASRSSSSQEIILRKEYVRSQHSQPVQQSAIQWIGTPQTTLPASTFLRQLYVNRESVIRSGAHPTRPSYYSDVQGTLPTPPSSGAESYTTKTNSESYGIIPNYSSTGNTFMDTCSAMTPPASVSPRDKFHSSTADASAFSEAGISHLRHYVTVDRCADPSLHHLPLKPQVFVHPGSIDTSAYNHSHSSPEQQQLYAHHGFHLYHTSGKSSHHPTNGASWYPQPNS